MIGNKSLFVMVTWQIVWLTTTLLITIIPTNNDAFRPIIIFYSKSSTRAITSAIMRRKGKDNVMTLKNSLDYEYLPPNPEATLPNDPLKKLLPSGFPPDIPAGLRGEAIRSALTNSERCITWNLQNSPLSMGGIVEITGPGMLQFLNAKVTQQITTTASKKGGRCISTCLLTPKGYVMDQLQIAILSPERAFILTSPGFISSQLVNQLEPLIFPMDQVTLTHHPEEKTFICTLASTHWEHVQTVIHEQVDDKVVFDKYKNKCMYHTMGTTKLLLLPTTGLPRVTCKGYTMVFFSNAPKNPGRKIWNYLIDEDNEEGPVHVGALEYDALRIEAGVPAYGNEYYIIPKTIQKKSKVSNIQQQPTKEEEEKKLDKQDDNVTTNDNDTAAPTSSSSSAIVLSSQKKERKTNPLELHLQNLISTDKGCYLGQEGVASVMKNPRGPPRILYSVVFQDDDNIYQEQSGDVKNLTIVPKEGDKLYVLGSNGQILVGTITSLAEIGGTGKPNIVGLVLVRRADTILKQIYDMNLDPPSTLPSEQIIMDPDVLDVGSPSSGLIPPPPLDPLTNMEVIVEGTYTIGSLQMVPIRKFRSTQNMFDEYIIYDQDEEEQDGDNDRGGGGGGMSAMNSSTTTEPQQREQAKENFSAWEVEEEDDDDNNDNNSSNDNQDEDDDLERAQREAAQAQAEAEAAAAEAKRKEEKMKMLQKRAEEAMARRRKAKQQQQQQKTKE